MCGILSAGLGLHGFLLPGGLIDGGVTGVSMLTSRITGWPLAALIPVVNLPFIVLGYKQLGAAFAVRSMLAIGGLALALALIHFPNVTHDLVLTAVFGGFFLGAGIGLAVRGLAVLGVEPALYSILTYVSAARTLDFIIHGIEEYTAMTIMSDENDRIRRRIMAELGRGVTVYQARGGLTGDEREVLYCVVTRLEIGRIRTIIRETDERAFVITQPLADVQGGTVRKRVMH